MEVFGAIGYTCVDTTTLRSMHPAVTTLIELLADFTAKKIIEAANEGSESFTTNFLDTCVPSSTLDTPPTSKANTR